MRLWSLHPRLLDAKGLVALWREGLLAQKVLQGLTKGYRRHPQLDRFRGHASPLSAIAAFLQAVHREAERRGYRFDAGKIAARPARRGLAVTRGQLRYELAHLKEKLRRRDPAAFERLVRAEPHPFFRAVPGGPERWERRSPPL